MRSLRIWQHFSPTVLPFSLLALADMAGKLLAFLTIPMITHRFGDAAFGDIGVATQLMVFGVLVATSGLDVYSVRIVAREPGAIGEWASTVMSLRLTLGALVYAGLMAAAALIPSYQPVLLLIAIFGLSLFTRAIYLDWAAQALRATRVLAAAMFSIQLLYFGFIVLAIAMQRSVVTVAIAQITAEALTATWLLWWLRRHGVTLAKPRPPREWPAVLRQSMPFAGSQVLRGASLGLDLVLLSAYTISRAEIGWFSGAIKVYQLCSGIAAAYFLILLPRLSASAGRSRQEMNQELSHSFKTILPLAAAAALIVGLFAKPILHLIGGSVDFEGVALPLQVLLAGVVVGLANGHYRNALFAIGRQHADMTNVAISAVVHVVLKVMLIPLLGVLGVAIGTLGGEVTLTLLGRRTLRRSPDSADPVATLADSYNV